MKKIIVLVLVCVSLIIQSGCFSGSQNTPAENNSEIASDNSQQNKKDSYVSKAHIEAKYIGVRCIDVYEEAFSDSNYADSSSRGYYNYSAEMYGIITPFSETGCDPKFYACRHIIKDYYNVSTKKLPWGIDPEIVNSTGVADINGNIIVPEQYCAVEYLNDRFFKVITVTEFADSPEEAVLEDAPFIFSYEHDSGDFPYKGKWEIYDVEKKGVVPGASGALREPIYAYGNIIEFNNTFYTPDGKAHPEYAKVLKNGCYVIEDEDNNCTLYDKDSNKLFDYSAKTMNVDRSCENNPELMIASSGTDNTTKEYIIDMNGKKVSAEFYSVEDVYFDKYVVTKKDGKFGLSQLDGKEIAPCEYSGIKIDTDFGLELFALQNSDEIKFIDSYGTVIASTPCDNNISPGYNDNVVWKQLPDVGWRCLNIKTGEFDIEPNNTLRLNWCVEALIETDDGFTSGIVDTLTGNTIIESNAEKEYRYFYALGNYILASYPTSINADAYDLYELTLEY